MSTMLTLLLEDTCVIINPIPPGPERRAVPLARIFVDKGDIREQYIAPYRHALAAMQIATDPDGGKGFDDKTRDQAEAVVKGRKIRRIP